jgi:hypothetical protein
MHDGTSLHGLDAEKFTVATADQYQLQAEYYCKLIRSAAKPSSKPLEDALRNMQTIDALFKSERSGRFERVRR